MVCVVVGQVSRTYRRGTVLSLGRRSYLDPSGNVMLVQVAQARLGLRHRYKLVGVLEVSFFDFCYGAVVVFEPIL